MKILHLFKLSFSKNMVQNCIVLFILTMLLNTASAQISVMDTSRAIEEKLVQLALEGPEIQKTAHQTAIGEYQLKAAQNVWMNLLAFNINYNEQTLAKNTPTTAYVYPRYNLGVTIPLGTIFSRTAIKSAKENIEIGKDNTELAKRSMREQVLTAYKEYVAYGQLIAMQSELVNDVKTQLAQSEDKFRSGTISIDAYNSAQKNNNAELATLINLKLQQDLKKIELEKLIGVKLETVLRR